MIRSSFLVRTIGLALALAAAASFAQLRRIPDEAVRGRMSHLQEMIVEINGKAMRLAPGAQIRDANNFIVLPMAVPPGSLVKYTLDVQGWVQRAWILSDAEAAQPDPRK